MDNDQGVGHVQGLVHGLKSQYGNVRTSGRPDKAASIGGAPARGEVSYCGDEYGRILRLPATAYPALVCTALRYDTPHVVQPMEIRPVCAGGHPPVALALRLLVSLVESRNISARSLPLVTHLTQSRLKTGFESFEGVISGLRKRFWHCKSHKSKPYRA